MTTSKFLALHPVFSLDQARAALSGDVRQRIGRAVLQGRVIRLRREIFATVPADRESKSFLPSPYLVMPLERPDADPRWPLRTGAPRGSAFGLEHLRSLFEGTQGRILNPENALRGRGASNATRKLVGRSRSALA